MKGTTFRCLYLLGFTTLLGSMVVAADAPELVGQPQPEPAAGQNWLGGLLRQWLGSGQPKPIQPAREQPAPEKRDPFATTPEMLKQASGGPTVQGGPVLPSLKLKGLAKDRLGAVAIMEADGSAVVFVRAGDVVNISTKTGTSTVPFKVVSIDRDSLIVEVGDTGRTLVVR